MKWGNRREKYGKWALYLTGEMAGKSKVGGLYQNWGNIAPINIGEKIITQKNSP
jgi:hypothetical protein